MAGDDLTKPLGLPRPKPRPSRLRALGVGAVTLAIIGVMAGMWSVLVHDPQVGASRVKVASDGSAPLAPTRGKRPTTERTGAIAVAPAAISTASADDVGLVEVLPDGDISDISDTGIETIVIGEPEASAPLHLAAAPVEDLVEDGPSGLLPRVGPAGERPLDAYARPFDAASAGRKWVAIVVGGVGISEDSSKAAIALPGAVTLAFAPYGQYLPKALVGARNAGHEVLLQIPLEPYGYPNNNPGPHTLTVNASPEENIGRLHWLMSRTTTYVGVMNYLGARFTSEEQALAPVMSEIGKRGLLYLDDGSSGMSLADRLAGTMPFMRADVVLDPITEAAAIDQRLAELEAIARRRGYSVATATAFPVTVERIAEFAKSAAERGIDIVPLTVLVARDRA